MGLIDTLSNRKITLNYDVLNELEFSRFYEQIQIVVVKYVAGNDKALLAKLRRPIHVSYISKYLVKLPMDDTMNLLSEMIVEGLVEESVYGKGYYVIKQKQVKAKRISWCKLVQQHITYF